MVIFFLIILIIIYLYIDFNGLKYISIEEAKLSGLNVHKSKELIIQDIDNDNNIFATRGLILYCLYEGKHKFKKIAHLPLSFDSFYWIYNFTLFRKLTNKPECIETIITKNNHIVAFSGGFMWHKSPLCSKFTKTLKLRHYGHRIGRGILSNGITADNLNNIYFGEYFRNTSRTDVRIYKSKDDGISWNTEWEFDAGVIRHIHSLQMDPFTSNLWICCGDKDNESLIGFSSNGYQNIKTIGCGSQMWRTSQLVFTEKEVIWGTDTGSTDQSGIYSWNKDNQEITKLFEVQGAILFSTRLNNGILVFSSDREGFQNETDNFTRLYIIKSGRMKDVKVGTWEYSDRKDIRFSFAMNRFPRGQNHKSLAFSIINQSEFDAGELYLISEESIMSLMKEN